MVKCLVLGANGFIGSHLVDELSSRGYGVRAFDRYSNKQIIFTLNKNVEIFSGDFLNRADLQKSLEGMDYVFHFISTTTPATAENDPLIDIDTNIRSSVELFKLCTENRIKKIIFASTGGAIYGKDSKTPFMEDDLPLPISPYAIGKLTIEHYLRYFRIKHGLESLVFRISNPYGERQPLHRKQGVIPIFLENIVQGKPITVLGDGTMVRDYIYVGDVASILVNLFEKNTTHHTYNLGSGIGVSLNELVGIIKDVTGEKILQNNEPAPQTFVHKVILDTKSLNNELLDMQLTKLTDGVQRTYNYVKKEIENNA